MLLLTDDALWASVQRLAVERETQIELFDGDADGEWQLWYASSYSRPGTWHVVEINVDSRGVRYSCTCERHRDGRGPCTHVAAVLSEIRMLPALPSEPEPVALVAVVTPDEAQIKRLRGRRMMAVANDDDDEADRLAAEIITLGGRL